MDSPTEPKTIQPPAEAAKTGGFLVAPRRWLRGLYNWTISWAGKPSAMGALFTLSAVESSVFPIPPDPLLMAIAVARPRQWFRAAAVCTIGSVLGGCIGYLIGWGFMEAIGKPVVAFYHAQHHWDKIEHLYRTWGISFLAAAAFTPIPFKVATIAAGATHMAFVPFVITSVFGRGARFFLVAALVGRFGPGLKEKLERHFDWLSLVFLALLVLGFLSIKLFL